MKYTLKEHLGFYIYWLQHLFCKHYWIVDSVDGTTYHRCSYCKGIMELFPNIIYEIYLDNYLKNMIKEFKRKK